MMQRIFRASNGVLSGALVIGLSGLLSRVLGVYRDRLLATTFGAGASLDAYYAAFRIPDFMYNLLVLGALSAGFIPLFTERLGGDNKQAWRLAQSVFFLLLGTLIVTVVILYLFAPGLVEVVAPGFDADTANLTIRLTHIMLLSPILLGLSSVFGGVLQSFKRFLAYSVAPILYNLGIIAGIFLFTPSLGVVGVAWGVIIGAGLHLILQFYVAKQLGWQWSFHRRWDTKGIREILYLMGPRTLSLVIFQLNLLVVTIFASRLGEGSITIFNFANNLAHVPIGLFGISFAVSVFPVLSEYAAVKNEQSFQQTFAKTFLQISFFLAPTVVLFLLLDEQIVRLVYGAGQFDWQATLLTAHSLMLMIPGIIAQALLPLISRAFYAKKNTLQPFLAACLGLVSTILFAWLLTAPFVHVPSTYSGVPMLSLAYSLGGLFQMGYLSLLLRGKQFRQYSRTIIAILGASFAVFLTVQMTKVIIGPYLNLLTVKGVLVHFLLSSLVGGIVYLLVMKYSRSELYADFEKKLLARLRAFDRSALPAVATGEEDDLL